jgi:hypothetical protein
MKITVDLIVLLDVAQNRLPHYHTSEEDLHRAKADRAKQRSAGFLICRIADSQVGSPAMGTAGLETRGTADLEVCATLNRSPPGDA